MNRAHQLYFFTGFLGLTISAATAANVDVPIYLDVPIDLPPLESASTIRHDVADANYTAHAAQAQFAAVGIHSIPGTCSFTVIQTSTNNGKWGLTAAHCLDINNNGTLGDETHGDDTFTIGAEAHTIQNAIIHPSYDGNIANGFDIGLVEFDAPFTTVIPAQIYMGTNEVGATITSVGFGATGDGQTGQSLGAGTKRAVDNIVDFNSVTGVGPAGSALFWDFDEPAPRTSPNLPGSPSAIPLALEGSVAQGDSGGGSFINDGGWFVAGVHSGISDIFDYPGNGFVNPTPDLATYGDGILVTRVSHFAPWILQTVPEPSSAILLLLGGLSLIGRRRR